MRGNNRKAGGFTVWEILTAVVLIVLVGVVGGLLLRPTYVVNHPASPSNTCINNLRIIGGAKGQWATEFHKQITDTPTASDIQPYMGRTSTGELPCCPNDGEQKFDTSYSINNVSTKPVCRILPTTHILP